MTIKIRTVLISLLPQLIIIYQNGKIFYIKYHRIVTLTTHKKIKPKIIFFPSFIIMFIFTHTNTTSMTKELWAGFSAVLLCSE